MPKIERKALRRSMWASISRVLGIVMASGAGSVIVQTLGNTAGWALPLGVGLFVLGFFLIWFAEYEREIE